jgi:transglutaminase-like putative cysteine protease
MLFSVHHRTTYRYPDPVSLSHHMAHLRPRDLPYQSCRLHHLSITPLPASIEEDQDYFGNGTVTFVIAQPHRELIVEAVSEVDIQPRPLPEDAGHGDWRAVAAEAEAAATPAALFAAEFAFPSPAAPVSPAVAEFAGPSFAEGGTLRAAVLDLCHRIHDEFVFDPRATTVHTPPQEVLKLRRGVCQDFAHLAIACCRAMGIPARYVSGYLETEPPIGQPKLVGADASHAWLAVYAGDGDWIEIDPTNDKLAGEGHIAVAYGRDYDDVCPIKGIIHGGGNHGIEVAVDVERRLL